MQNFVPFAVRLCKWTFLLFTIWVGWNIVAPYPHYVPPDFAAGFLRGREDYFYNSAYGIGFFAHIASAPLAVLTGAIQSSRTLQTRWPKIHRHLGSLYVVLVLFFAAPGGLIMAQQAYGGWSSKLCFSLIAIVAWIATWLGWRSARRSLYRDHADWMQRSYALMLSAIFLRVIHISIRPLGWDHESAYQFSAWCSFLLPLILVEILIRCFRPKSLTR